ncbi:MAG: putative peptide maturation dehydrogenase, partial [Acidobacteriota bacterium]
TRIVAFSPVSESQRAISLSEVRLLAGLPAETWSPVSDLDLEGTGLSDLVESGLLICDGEDPLAQRLRRREERLASLKWHPLAASYHFGNRLAEGKAQLIDMEAMSESAESGASRFVEKHGSPPPPFRELDEPSKVIELPLSDKQGGLYDALRARKTVRKFDPDRSLARNELSTLLRYVFGCHGYSRISEIVLLHKTSPSGGSLHPIEAYPLVINVEGLSSGVYHYDVRDHSLESIRELDEEACRELAVEFCRGQQYASSAHALVLLVARFDRNQWKYRSRSRTYSVMLMDAGHLSQTFYLVAAELGLGAFFSAAIDGQRIEKVLNLDSIQEGALGVCGCGVPQPGGTDLGLETQPFAPRSTRID